MRKSILLIALLAGGLAACMTGPIVRPSIHIEPPTPGAAASLTLDERIAVQDAWNALREGRMDKARRLFARLPQANPFVAAGFGYIAIIDQNLAAAEDYLQRALEIQPELTVAYLGLGQVYQKTGQEQEAYRAYREALKREPENAFAQKNADDLAESLTDAAMAEAERTGQAGETEASKAAYLRALEYSPRLKKAHNALARLFIKEKDFHSAYLHMKAAGDDRVEDVGLLREFADALYKSGQWSRSLEIYEQIASAVAAGQGRDGPHRPDQEPPGCGRSARPVRGHRLGPRADQGGRGRLDRRPVPRSAGRHEPQNARDRGHQHVLGPALHRQGGRARRAGGLFQPHLPA